MGDLDEIIEQTMKALRKDAADRYFGNLTDADKKSSTYRGIPLDKLIDAMSAEQRARMYTALYKRGMTLTEAEKILREERK